MILALHKSYGMLIAKTTFPSTSAAVMRNGLVEMKNFGLEFFKDVKAATFLEESAGVADLMTSCMGGRNRKVAEAFARTGKSFDELEKELLGGQSESGPEQRVGEGSVC
jgi:glycerol-3-phosphate dehydrogenase (NAD+)